MTDPRTPGLPPGMKQTPRGLILPAGLAPATVADPGESEPRPPRVRTSGSEWLRYLPPGAALGTAAVLQVVGVTDLVGTAIADRMADLYPDLGWTWVWYALAALFGVAVACSLEGSAAYLMDLYDKHLLARDSVWVLRLGMVGYVGLSGGLIHWWLSTRGLPELIAWVLAAMSGSALFLWSRGSRWRNRRAMEAAGQIDPALPRFPIGTKLLHPARTLVTIRLITWGPPVRTLDGARRRYAAWKRLKRVRKVAKQTLKPSLIEDAVAVPVPVAHADPPHEPDPRPDPDDAERPDPDEEESKPKPNRARRTPRVRHGLRSVDDDRLVSKLRKQYPDRTPSINEVQQTVGGGRSRAIRLRGLLDGEGEGSETDKEGDVA